MIHSDYKKLYYNALKTYSPKFKKELQRQVDEFCRTGNLNSITGEGLEKTIKELHYALGTKMAGIAYKDVKKQAKSVLFYEQKAFAFLDLWKTVIFNYLDKKGLTQLVNEITNTTKEQIRRYLIKGQQENLTLQETIKNLQSAGITNYRAAMIARTETGKAANVGSIVGAISTGVVSDKMWISTIDSRTRRTPPSEFDHLEMNGQTIAMDEYFMLYSKDGGADMMLHPCDINGSAADVINCRCTIGYVPKRDGAGNLLRYENNPPKGDAGIIWATLASLM